MAHRIDLYETESGRSPIRDYLKGMPKPDGPKAVNVIWLLEDNGLGLLEWPHHMAPLRGRLYELRIRGEQYHRIIVGYVPRFGFVLLHAFSKKTNKTPAKEIEVAEQRLLTWLARSKKAGYN